MGLSSHLSSNMIYLKSHQYFTRINILSLILSFFKCVNYLKYNVLLDLKSHEHGLIHIVQDKNTLVAKFNKSTTAIGFGFTDLET